MTAEPCSLLCRQVNVGRVDTTAIELLKCRHRQMAALISGVFWPRLCLIGGKWETVSIFISSLATTRHLGPKLTKNKRRLSLRNEWDWILSYQGSSERCWALVCGWTQILLESWPPLHNLRHAESRKRKKDKRGLFTGGGREGIKGSHTWVAFSAVGRRWTKQRLRIAATFLGSRPQLPCLALC